MGGLFMEVKVKRQTGLMGGVAKVTLLVDGQETAKLKNNEEHVIHTEEPSIQLKAKSGLMGSRPIQTTSGGNVEIKVNPMCILLFIASIALIFMASMTDVQEMKLAFAIVGLVGVIATFVLSITSWFVLRK